MSTWATSRRLRSRSAYMLCSKHNLAPADVTRKCNKSASIKSSPFWQSKSITSYRPNFRLGPTIALSNMKYSVRRKKDPSTKTSTVLYSKRRNSFVRNFHFQRLSGRKFATDGTSFVQHYVCVNGATFGFERVIFKWARRCDFSKSSCYLTKLKHLSNLMVA